MKTLSSKLQYSISVNIQDESLLRKYANAMNRHAAKKVKFFIERLPPGEKRTIVDVGCCGGRVTATLARILSNDKVIGIDTSDVFLREVLKMSANFKVLKASILDLPFRDDNIDAFLLSAVLHEVYSYNGFSKESCRRAFREMYRCLKKGGRIIIRDPQKPSDPNDGLFITLDKENGTNYIDDEDLYTASPSRLSTFCLFRKFILELKPIQSKLKKIVLDRVGKENEFLVPAWLIAEFIRKRTFTDSKEHWNAEMLEQNAAFTVEDIRELAKSVGFSDSHINIQSYFEPDFYGKIRRQDKIYIKDKSGNKIIQSQRFPSHLYVVLEK